MKKKAKKDLKPDDVIVVAEQKKLIEGAEELSMADSTTLTQGKSEGEVLHKKQIEPIDEDSDIANINKPARKRSQSLTEELGLYKQSSSQSEGVQSTKINSETQQNELNGNGNTNSSRETQHNTSLQSSEFSLTSPDQKASGTAFIPPPPNIDEFRYIMSVPDPVTMRAGSPGMTPQLLAKVSNAQNFEGNSIGIQATAIPMPAPAPKKRSDVVEKRIREMVEIDEESTIHTYFKDGPLVYQLAGVLIHRGGAYGGHYYAYIRSFEDGEWHLFDDAIIKTVTKMQVAEEGFGGKNLSASGYMLFYQIVEDIIPQGNWLEIPKDLKDICSAELAKEREQGRIELFSC